MNKRDKPRVISVYPPRPVQPRRTTESLEDEAPTIPLAMATPAISVDTAHLIPPVIVLRPSWLDLPARRLASRITLLGVCSILATIIVTIIVTIVIHIAWRLS